MKSVLFVVGCPVFGVCCVVQSSLLEEVALERLLVSGVAFTTVNELLAGFLVGKFMDNVVYNH